MVGFIDNRDIAESSVVLHQNLFDQIISKENLLTSWQEFKLGRRNKCDVRKFFDSIDHQIIFELIKKRIFDPDVQWLLGEIIDSYSLKSKTNCGAPLGNLTSQLFSNIYLNSLDHFVKRELKEKYYLRYADDFVILSCNRDHLENLVPTLRSFLADELKLELHPNKIILRKWSQGIDLLGYVIFPHHIVLRTKTKRRMLRNIKNNYRLLNEGGISKESFDHHLQSYLGLLKHCRSQGLLNEINILVKNII